VRDPGPGRGGSERVHTVRRGESLWSIARRYGVRLVDLISLNRLPRNLTIYPGQKIRVY
jgi:membrane-bound lytic murein transglycosylase D